MTRDQIRRDIAAAPSLPAQAMRAAVPHAATFAPEVIALLQKAAGDVYLLPADGNLLFYGMHVLAAARETALYRPLLSLLRLPEYCLEDILGFDHGGVLPRLLVSVFDGDAEPLYAAVEDQNFDGYMR